MGRVFRCYGAHFLLLDAVLGLDPSCLGWEHSSFWTPALTNTPLWHLLLEAPGSGRFTRASVTFGRKGQELECQGGGGMAPVPDWDPFPKLARCGQTGRVTGTVVAVPRPPLTPHLSPAG